MEEKRADCYVEYAKLTNADYVILCLQGVPKFGAPSPKSIIEFSDDSSWLKRKQYKASIWGDVANVVDMGNEA